MMGWGYSSLVEYLACMCAWCPLSTTETKKRQNKHDIDFKPLLLGLDNHLTFRNWENLMQYKVLYDRGQKVVTKSVSEKTSNLVIKF